MNQQRPITYIQALGLMLMGLKLSNAIDWSWWPVILLPVGLAAFEALAEAICRDVAKR